MFILFNKEQGICSRMCACKSTLSYPSILVDYVYREKNTLFPLTLQNIVLIIDYHCTGALKRMPTQDNMCLDFLFAPEKPCKRLVTILLAHAKYSYYETNVGTCNIT